MVESAKKLRRQEVLTGSNEGSRGVQGLGRAHPGWGGGGESVMHWCGVGGKGRKGCKFWFDCSNRLSAEGRGELPAQDLDIDSLGEISKASSHVYCCCILLSSSTVFSPFQLVFHLISSAIVAKGSGAGQVASRSSTAELSRFVAGFHLSSIISFHLFCESSLQFNTCGRHRRCIPSLRAGSTPSAEVSPLEPLEFKAARKEENTLYVPRHQLEIGIL